jgi:hypothetical protein
MLDKPAKSGVREATETCDGMTIDWHSPITTDDGRVVRADVFRPVTEGKFPIIGCGPFLHEDPRDRPPEIFGGQSTIHAGPEGDNCLLPPVIPRCP